ncbi:phosphate-binding protein [Staphylococcus aureus]|nr:phosphate-binding protein [Staphylococcus aureus]
MKKWQFVGTTALGATLLLGACGGGMVAVVIVI